MVNTERRLHQPYIAQQLCCWHKHSVAQRDNLFDAMFGWMDGGYNDENRFHSSSWFESHTRHKDIRSRGLYDALLPGMCILMCLPHLLKNASVPHRDCLLGCADGRRLESNKITGNSNIVVLMLMLAKQSLNYVCKAQQMTESYWIRIATQQYIHFVGHG